MHSQIIEAGFYNMDCMDGMKQFPDKFFGLAICDPPYGDGGGGAVERQQTQQVRRPVQQVPHREVNHAFGGRFARYAGGAARTGGTWAEKYSRTAGGLPRENDIRHWDVAPPPEYFDELFRISKHQIIWGGNYFDLPPTRNFIIWRKLTISENFSMAMAEYAWTNIKGNAKVVEAAPQGTKAEERFHPTQKPIELYKWLLTNYAKKGDKILDTHVGSASSLIACHQLGFQYWGFEIDKEYYRMANVRLEKAKAQVGIVDLMSEHDLTTQLSLNIIEEVMSDG